MFTKLELLRGESGKTLAEVSGATGVAASHVSHLEKGKSRGTVRTLLKFARYYSEVLGRAISIDDLFDGDRPPKKARVVAGTRR